MSTLQGWQCPICGQVYAPFIDRCARCTGNSVPSWNPNQIPTMPGKPWRVWCTYTSDGISPDGERGVYIVQSPME